MDVAGQRAAFVDAMRSCLPSERAQCVVDLLRPALRLVEGGDDRAVTIGGGATMPSESPWPTHRDRPIELVAVVDLSALRARFPDVELPDGDVVNIFFDLEDPYTGDADARRVVAVDRRGSISRPPPSGAHRLPETRGRLVGALTAPSWEEPALCGALGTVDPYEWWRTSEGRAVTDALFAWDDLVGLPRADEGQVGGWPELYQAPIFEHCQHAGTPFEIVLPGAARSRDGRQWRQLLQVGWHDSLDHFVGDGRLHVCYDRLATPPLARTWVTIEST